VPGQREKLKEVFDRLKKFEAEQCRKNPEYQPPQERVGNIAGRTLRIDFCAEALERKIFRTRNHTGDYDPCEQMVF